MDMHSEDGVGMARLHVSLFFQMRSPLKKLSLKDRERLKAQRAAHRLKKREDLRHMETTCFACRGVGHAARDCPNILLEAQMPEGTADMLGGKSSGTQSATEPSLKGMKRKKGTRGAELVGGRCYR